MSPTATLPGVTNWCQESFFEHVQALEFLRASFHWLESLCSFCPSVRSFFRLSLSLVFCWYPGVIWAYKRSFFLQNLCHGSESAIAQVKSHDDVIQRSCGSGVRSHARTCCAVNSVPNQMSSTTWTGVNVMSHTHFLMTNFCLDNSYQRPLFPWCGLLLPAVYGILYADVVALLVGIAVVVVMKTQQHRWYWNWN